MNLYLNFVRNPASWQISLNYAKFMGGETPYDQLYRDRDYVASRSPAPCEACRERFCKAT